MQFASYPLAADGAMRNWLACGTVTSPITDIVREVVDPEGSPFGHGKRWIMTYWAFDPESAALKMKVYRRLPRFTWQPGPPPILQAEGIANLPWRYAVAEQDNVIDFSLFNFSPALMQGWLYANIEAPEAKKVSAELITIGPVRLWVNGILVEHFDQHFSYVAVQRVPVTLSLQKGSNEVYVHGEMLGWREARLALGLRIPESPNLAVRIPLGDISAQEWHDTENGLNSLQFRQFAVPKLPATIRRAASGPEKFTFELEVASPEPDRFWAASVQQHRETRQLTLGQGETAELPLTAPLLDAMARTPGEHAMTMTWRPVNGLPLAVNRELWRSSVPFSMTPYGTYEARRTEALEHLAAMPYDVLTSMAAVTLGKQKYIASEAIAGACYFLENRFDCADFYAIGLLAMLNRFGDTEALRDTDRAHIETAFLNFKFWIDEPGIDAMCYFTENHQVLFHVAAYLAGQRWPNRVFANSGLTGNQQQLRARPRIESWILRRLRGNFSEWDSNAYMTLDAFAMLAVVEFDDNVRLRELATALLDKLFFLIACQSYRGAHGSTHGRCYVSGLKSARAENTSSLQRIGWGMGIFNGETRATGLLAMAQRYRIPDVLQQIGMDLPDVLVTRAHSRADFRPQFDMKPGTWDVRTITRRTPDGMLSATIDYRPGEMGIQEHLCQLTLGPEAVIFTNYPGNSQEHGNARPNFWAGSARLPRVGMAGRTAICIYRLEERVGMGFTHAYFPVEMFDEYRISGNWAFARVGNGYAALWGAGPLKLTEFGRHAGEELRSTGNDAVWIYHLGRQAEDGDFANFMASVQAHEPQVDGLNVCWQPPDGKTMCFGWEGPFLVDGKPENWEDFPHYDNLYTHTPLDAEQMTINCGNDAITLDLQHGHVVPEKP